MSENVQNDAQMSMFQVLRPLTNFEALYQGLAGTIPIAFPGTLDPQAGQEHFNPRLLRGIPVPMMSRVLVQIPMVIDMYTSVPDYVYQFVWRTRNQQAYVNAILSGRPQAGFHLKSEELGRKETQAFSNSEEYFFIPGCGDVEIFEQAEPSGGASAIVNVRQKFFRPQMADSWVQPITADGSPGVWQQGAYQYTNNVNCAGPTWFALELPARGDELMILAYKANSGVAWDFAGADLGFSNTYGTNNDGTHSLPNNANIGILLSTGTTGA